MGHQGLLSRVTAGWPIVGFCVLCVTGGLPQESSAIPLVGDGVLGDFAAEVTYTPTGVRTATLEVALTNASPIFNGGFLTAFAFNNPGTAITDVSLASTNSTFTLIGGPGFDNGINGAPFGAFDLGASATSGSFLGGGSPRGGIPPRSTETFTFTMIGSGLDTLSIGTFVSELSGPQGGSGECCEFFMARFRGFEDGGSDKTPGSVPTTHLPEPTSMMLLASGLVGFGAWRFFAQRRCRGKTRPRPV